MRLYSGRTGGRRRRGESLVRQRQPLGQQTGRFIGRLAVKGHHRGRHAWAALQLRPPPVADGRDLDVVCAPANGLFKMMNDHVCDIRFRGLGAATILFAGPAQSSEATHEGCIHSVMRDRSLASRAEINFPVRFSTAFAPVIHRISTQGHGKQVFGRRYNTDSGLLVRFLSLLIVVWLAAPPAAHAATDATLFRLFLRDGTSVVSFGEFARLDDQVVFSMPVGGPADEPRLHVVTLPASQVDWVRTDRYAAAARAQHYAETRGEEDFQLLSSDIARVLNEVALSTDKNAALSTAERARQTLADWPTTHFSYRERDVREVVALLDEAISDLRAAAGRNDFALALVATPEQTSYEPVLGMPGIAEQINTTFRVARLTRNVADRVALLQTTLALIAEAGHTISSRESGSLRRTIEEEIRLEAETDEKYAVMSRRLMATATTAATQARIADVERVLNKVAKEDTKLGGRRPEVVQALSTSLQVQLDNARRLRLLRDQWQVHRASYREYQRTVGSQLLQLVKMQPSLDAIRRLAGPSPAALLSLRRSLGGGAERLQRLRVPEDLRSTHELLVSAWRFAATAVDIRYSAVSSGDVAIAWQASSSAAGALLMVARVQQDIKALLEPPRLQ